MARNSSSYAQMRAVLDSQKAVNDQIEKTMAALTTTANIINHAFSPGGSAFSPDYQRYANEPLRYPAGGGPESGNRPRVGDPYRPDQSGAYQQNYRGRRYDQEQAGGAYGSHHGRGLAGIRRMATGRLEGAFGRSSGSTYERTIDRQTGEHVGYRETTSSGQVIQRQLGEVSSSDLAGAAARSTTSGVLDAMGMGGMMAGARAIPYVGGAIMAGEALHEAATFVTNQRAANAQYQSIYNSSNLAGLGQRADQLGFQLGNLFGGGLSWGQAQEAFQGVSALGYQGSKRDTDLSFIKKNYMDMGVSVSDSLKLVQTAAGSLNEELTGLQQGLADTRDQAAQTGQNANIGTQILQNTYSGLTGAGFAGGGVGTISSAIAQVQAGMGRYMSSIPIGQMLQDPTMLIRMAADISQQTGKPFSMTQLQNAIETGDVRKVFQGIDARFSMGSMGVLGNQKSQSIIHQLTSQYGGAHTYKGGMRQAQIATDPSDLIDEITRRLKSTNAVNIQNVQAQMFAQTGLQLTPDQAINMAVQGELGLSQQRIQGAIQRTMPHVDARKSIQREETSEGTASGSSVNTYKTRIHTDWTGVNPTLDAIKNEYKDKGDTPVVVQAGPDKHDLRVVTMDEAIKDYPDQLALGKAKLASTQESVARAAGKGPQKSFMYAKDWQKYAQHASATGPGVYKGSPTSVEGGTVEAPTTTKAGAPTDKAGTSTDARSSKQGEAWQSYRADQLKNAQQQAKSGKVMIQPSETLKRLLSFSATGNAYIAGQGAAAGLPPAPGVGQ